MRIRIRLRTPRTAEMGVDLVSPENLYAYAPRYRRVKRESLPDPAASDPFWWRAASRPVELASRSAPAARNSRRVSLEDIAGGVAELLGPVATSAAALGLWRLGSDMRWAGPFFIDQGLLSHWQVWLGLAGTLQGQAFWLRRRARAAGRREIQPAE